MSSEGTVSPKTRYPFLLVAALATGLYLATMPRDLTLEDSGLFLLACRHLGIAHPPGYPLYTLLGHGVLVLLGPFLSPPVALHLLSAVFGGLTAGMLFLVARQWGLGQVAAVLAGLLYAGSRAFWSQAIIAEVYTLHTFFFFTLLWLALRHRDEPGPGLRVAIAILLGLALGHHWPLMLLSAPAIGLVLLASRVRIRGAEWGLLAGVFGAALILPWLWLVWRSRGDPVISFYGPIRSWSEFWFFVGRQGFADPDAAFRWREPLGYTWLFVREAAAQFTLAGAVLAGLGCWWQRRRSDRLVRWALVWAFLATGPVLAWLIRTDVTQPFYQAAFKVFPLVPYGIMALWIGGALERVADRFGSSRCSALGVGLVLLVLVVNLIPNNRTGYDYARRYARAVLDHLEPDAVLFVHTDIDTATLGYLHHVEGVRPDVLLVNDQGLVFASRLAPARASVAEKKATLDAFLQATPRPVYYTNLMLDNLTHRVASRRFGADAFGLFRQVNRAAKPGSVSYPYKPEVLDAADRLLASIDDRDTWTVLHRDALLRLCAAARVEALVLEAPWPPGALRERAAPVLGTFPGKLTLARARYKTAPARELLALLEEAEVLRTPRATADELERLYRMKGNVFMELKRVDLAVEAYEESVRHDARIEDNSCVLKLLNHYARTGNRAAFDRLAGRALKVSEPSPKQTEALRRLGLDPPVKTP